MGRVAATVAIVSIVVLIGCYELFGYLGSGVFHKGEVPLWLRSVQTTASIFQATATGLAFIIAGLFAYYRFFKEKT
jgi:predicted ferric reductase